MRQIVFVGFPRAQNCTNLVSSWRHPESRMDFTTPAYYQKIGQILEEGKFHLAFFDDRLTMPDLYGADYRHTVEHGIRCVKLDPVATMMAMGFGTTLLGIGATNSTTYYQLYHVARMFQTVDDMIGGRAAWNIVTSVNDGEALNFAFAKKAMDEAFTSKNLNLRQTGNRMLADENGRRIILTVGNCCFLCPRVMARSSRAMTRGERPPPRMPIAHRLARIRPGRPMT